jgi:polyhydroxybutyrate depolymerase
MKRAAGGIDRSICGPLLRLLVGVVLLTPVGSAYASEARASSGCGQTPALAPGESADFSIEVGNLDREYRLHLPRGYDPARPVSLVLDFHGYTGTAEDEEVNTTRFSPHADANGYVIVFPQGTGFVAPTGQRITSWNDLAGNASLGPLGPVCSDSAFKYPNPPECGEPRPCVWATCHDDLGFIDRLLDELEQTLCVDLDRIYATGMSNGAMFVHRLGCAMPERFAAIAPVSGTLARGFNCAPSATTPISIMNIYGSEDRYVDLENSMSSDGYYYTSAKDVMAKWAGPESQNCATTPSRYATSKDGTLDLECAQQADCGTGAEVVNCAWTGGHDWPKDGDHDFGNQIIWDFFSKHSRADYRAADNSD